MHSTQKNEKIRVQHLWSYGFSANVDSSDVQRIAKQIMELPGVYKAKGLYKPEKDRGQILIYTLYYKKEEQGEGSQSPFDINKVRKILEENNLQPRTQRRIK